MKLLKIGLLCLASILFSILIYTHSNKTKFTMARSLNSLKDVKGLFPKTVDDIKSLASVALHEARRDITSLIAIPLEEQTFDNTFGAYDRIVTRFNQAYHILELYTLVNPNDILRNAAEEQSLILQKEDVDLFSQNKQLYNALNDYATHNASRENLTNPESYFIEETLKNYKRNGVTLPEEQRKKVIALEKELSELTTLFDKNISTESRTFQVTREELSGLDDDFINSLQKNADGLYVLGSDYPTLNKIITFCSNAATRKKMVDLFNNRAYPQNEDVLKKIIEKRDQLAKLLGYPSYAHFSIEDQMAKTPENVEQFLNDLIPKLNAKATLEFEQFTKQLPDSVKLSPDGKIYPWDKAYLMEFYKKNNFNIDENEISSYFPTENTIKELLSIYQQFFSLEFKEEALSDMWNPDVKLITIYQNKQLIGYLFLDLYPRKNKYNHACHTTIVQALRSKNGKLLPGVSVLIANFPKASSTQPSLLKRDDALTFFHEFGHALHALLGSTELGSQGGTHVKSDFVEMPSQMLEEWISNEAILKKISKHYKTGEPLPDDTIKKLVDLKNFNIANNLQQQTAFAFTSLNYFKEGEQKDVYKIFKDLAQSIRTNDVFYDNSHFYASFVHLTGYGAKYYGYLWSKVFALDLFQYIKKEGLLNPAIGSKYQEAILSKGGSKDPNELLYDFLGRAPTSDAFMHNLGL